MTERENRPPVDHLTLLEESLRRDHAKRVSSIEVPCVFLLGSPRTGSTLLYQFLINHFAFHYPTNLFNDNFCDTPVAGACLEGGMAGHASVPYESRYGKTEGPWGPSEASCFFKRWFGGEHPSETCSKEPLPDMENLMVETFAALHSLSGNPLLFKNAWNCYRVKALARLFPASSFVWIRRDVAQAARSDLEARARRGGYEIWNSATPSNYMEIRERPYWEQVVEQQYEYGRRIETDFASSCPERSVQVWYEDLCGQPEQVLQTLDDFFLGQGMEVVRREPDFAFAPSLRKRNLESDEEGRRILEYLNSMTDDRLSSFRRVDENASVDNS